MFLSVPTYMYMYVCVEDGGAMFTSLRQVFHCIDKASFQDLATHILKGNQVIVRGNSITLVTSLIAILKVRVYTHIYACILNSL